MQKVSFEFVCVYDHDDAFCWDEPFHHLPTFSPAYRTLLIGPELTIPLRVWTVDGYRTMLCSSGVVGVCKQNDVMSAQACKIA